MFPQILSTGYLNKRQIVRKNKNASGQTLISNCINAGNEASIIREDCMSLDQQLTPIKQNPIVSQTQAENKNQNIDITYKSRNVKKSRSKNRSKNQRNEKSDKTKNDQSTQSKLKSKAKIKEDDVSQKSTPPNNITSSINNTLTQEQEKQNIQKQNKNLIHQNNQQTNDQNITKKQEINQNLRDSDLGSNVTSNAGTLAQQNYNNKINNRQFSKSQFFNPNNAPPLQEEENQNNQSKFDQSSQQNNFDKQLQPLLLKPKTQGEKQTFPKTQKIIIDFNSVGQISPFSKTVPIITNNISCSYSRIKAADSVKNQGSPYMLIETQGISNLNDKINKLEQCLDPTTIAIIGLQILKGLECLHDSGYVYGNNFSLSNLILNEREDQLSLFSYERCQEYRDPQTLEHYKQKRGSTFSGDAKFASINQMKMYTPSTRRDDLINLFYLMVYLRTMDLPWCDYLFCMPCSSHQKTFKMVLQKKEDMTLSKLTRQYQLPSQFMEIAKLIENLKIDQYPNYILINNLLQEVVNNAKPHKRELQWRRLVKSSETIMNKNLSGVQELLDEKIDFLTNSLKFDSVEMDMTNIVFQNEKTCLSHVDIDNLNLVEEKNKNHPIKARNTSVFNYHKFLQDESFASDSFFSKTRLTINNANKFSSFEQKDLSKSFYSNPPLSQLLLSQNLISQLKDQETRKFSVSGEHAKNEVKQQEPGVNKTQQQLLQSYNSKWEQIQESNQQVSNLTESNIQQNLQIYQLNNLLTDLQAKEMNKLGQEQNQLMFGNFNKNDGNLDENPINVFGICNNNFDDDQYQEYDDDERIWEKQCYETPKLMSCKSKTNMMERHQSATNAKLSGAGINYYYSHQPQF
eukprot:403334049